MAFSKVEWQRNQRREFAKKYGYSTNTNYSVKGQRAFILERDGNKCVICSMTVVEHLIKYGRPITIDHKDRNRKNNSPDNLQTLCLSCHGKKDQTPSIREPRFKPFLEEATKMRINGSTYQEIADRFGFSIAIAWKYLRDVKKTGGVNERKTAR